MQSLFSSTPPTLGVILVAALFGILAVALIARALWRDLWRGWPTDPEVRWGDWLHVIVACAVLVLVFDGLDKRDALIAAHEAQTRSVSLNDCKALRRDAAPTDVQHMIFTVRISEAGTIKAEDCITVAGRTPYPPPRRALDAAPSPAQSSSAVAGIQ
jgi:hypothetical protein